MKSHITVTQEMIDKGVAQDDCKCPIALAYREAGHMVSIAMYVVFLNCWRDDYKVANTESQNDFITAFDGYQPVYPQSFLVEFP